MIKEPWTANQKGLETRFNDHVKIKGTYELFEKEKPSKDIIEVD